MSGLLCIALQLFLLVIVVRSLLSFLPGASNSGAGAFVFKLTEPVLAPVRRVVPPVRMGAAGLDLSPLIVTFGIIILRQIIC